MPINKHEMDKIICWPAHPEKFESVPHHLGENIDNEMRYKIIQDLVEDAEIRVDRLPNQDAYMFMASRGGILNNAASNVMGRPIFGNVIIIPLVTLKKWGMKWK